MENIYFKMKHSGILGIIAGVCAMIIGLLVLISGIVLLKNKSDIIFDQKKGCPLFFTVISNRQGRFYIHYQVCSILYEKGEIL